MDPATVHNLIAMPRLHIPGSDEGTWGNLLNGFLRAEHNADGSHPDSLKKPDWSNIQNRPDLSRVDNTSDAEKPVSAAQQAAI